MIDIVLVSCERLEFTKRSVTTLAERTRTPYRLIVVDNGSTDGSVEWILDAYRGGLIHEFLPLKENYGIHWAWNTGLSMVKSDPYFVTSDNDVLCPDLEPDWLARQVDLMDKYSEFGAISLRPQVFVGGIPGWNEDHEVVEVPWAGAVLRIMRTSVVKEFGWEKIKRKGRDHEERWIGSHMRESGFKVGYARDIYAWHMFGNAWGYKGLSIEDQGHREMHPQAEHYDNIRVDPSTLCPDPHGVLMREVLSY